MKQSVPQTTFAVVKAQLDAAADVVPAMAALIQACARVRKSTQWKRLSALDFDAGSRSIATWLDVAFAEQPPPPEATGFWFGLFTGVARSGEDARAEIYARGCPFDADDPDWCCTTLWKPRRTYPRIELLLRSTRSRTPIQASGSTRNTSGYWLSQRSQSPHGRGASQLGDHSSSARTGSSSSASTRGT